MSKASTKVAVIAAIVGFVATFIFGNFSYAVNLKKTEKINPISAKALKGIFPVYPKIDYGTGDQAKLIKHGEYLARMGDCIACHTNTPEDGKPFAGGLPIETPFGIFYSPNLTPDKETGLGYWKLADFVTAMRHGKAPDGSNYFPVFPYVYFSNVSDQDLRALWAYLQAIPAVKKENRKPDVPFPFNWRFAQYGWKMLFFYPYDNSYKYDHDQTPAWNRGKYIVDGLGHCTMCHTPVNFLGGEKRRFYLTGNFIQGYWAPNITSYGLASATVEEVAKVFSADALINESGPVAGPMAEVNHNSLQHLSLSDQYAIAIYLKTVESEQPFKVTHGGVHQPTLERGKHVYQQVCSVCHQEGVSGAPRIGEEANWWLRAQQGRQVLYRHTINGYNQMPAKGACVTCTNRDIEAGVEYLLYKSLTSIQYANIDKPKKPRKKPTVAEGRKIYQEYCAVCHDDGKLGAPIVGNKQAWEPLIEKNMDVLIETTFNSHQPVKGGCEYCRNSEVIAAVKYMVQQSKSEGDYSLW